MVCSSEKKKKKKKKEQLHMVNVYTRWRLTCTFVTIEPPRDKTDSVAVSPAKTQLSLGVRVVNLRVNKALFYSVKS